MAKRHVYRIRTKPDSAMLEDIRDAIDGALRPMTDKERRNLFWQRLFLRTSDTAMSLD